VFPERRWPARRLGHHRWDDWCLLLRTGKLRYKTRFLHQIYYFYLKSACIFCQQNVGFINNVWHILIQVYLTIRNLWISILRSLKGLVKHPHANSTITLSLSRFNLCGWRTTTERRQPCTRQLLHGFKRMECHLCSTHGSSQRNWHFLVSHASSAANMLENLTPYRSMSVNKGFYISKERA